MAHPHAPPGFYGVLFPRPPRSIMLIVASYARSIPQDPILWLAAYGSVHQFQFGRHVICHTSGTPSLDCPTGRLDESSTNVKCSENGKRAVPMVSTVVLTSGT